MICNCKGIKEEVLNNFVVTSLRDVISKYANKDYILSNLYNNSNNNLKYRLEKEMQTLKLKLKDSINIKFNLYKDKVNSVISEKDYISFSSNVDKDIESYENRIKNINDNLERIDNAIKNKKDIFDIMNEIFNTDRLDRNDILQLINKIEIYTHVEHTKIKIYFKFKNT